MTSATIISGAVAERTQFGAYFIYTLSMIGFTFPCVSYWVWSDGVHLSVHDITYIYFLGNRPKYLKKFEI